MLVPLSSRDEEEVAGMKGRPAEMLDVLMLLRKLWDCGSAEF